MGREIRMVPKGWEHPRKDNGHYQPLHDEPFAAAAREWLDKCIAWDNGTYPDCAEHKADNPFFWQWEGNPPDPEYYRPEFTTPADHFQVYETVSEGTPVSPVFETEDQIVAWLIGRGHSEAAARNFVKTKWAMSGMIVDGKVYSGIDACKYMGQKE